jgi:histidinol-phosphate aminotransferase
MSVSRRTFVRTVGVGAAAAFGGRLLDGGRLIGPWTRDFDGALHAMQLGRPLLLHNNENPEGPGEKALAVMRAKLTERGIPTARYGFPTRDLQDAIAAKFGCKPENVLLGCGSTQILRSATHAFTGPGKALVGGLPTYEECGDMARLVGGPIKAVPSTRTMHHDLDAMAAAAKGAGMVFLDNPANPAATVQPATAVQAFLDRVARESPGTMILIDEAYHDYVTDPAHKTQIPYALEHPHVVVARTFSKAYGMAGLRIGYAIGRPETLRRMDALQYGMSKNVLGLAAATEVIGDDGRLERERRRNTEARQFTIDWFTSHGFTPTDSQCNFIFVDVKRSAREFREGCAKENVRVGRDFPPFEKSHSRVSIGTLAEMKQAAEIFAKVLGVKAAAAA